MMLANDELQVILVSIHVSLRDAIDGDRGKRAARVSSGANGLPGVA